MPKFTIVEIVREESEIEADTAQDALDIYINHGLPKGSETKFVSVDERWVEDADGEECETEEQH